MLLEQFSIDENLLKRMNPFKKKERDTDFNKIKEVTQLKRVLKSHINEYIKKVNTNPKNKTEYYDGLGEELLNAINLVISSLQNALSAHIGYKPIKESVEDKSLIRNLNFLFKELDLVDEETSLIDVEKILLHIYKKLKEHLDIKFPLDSEYDDIDPESENEDRKKYLNKFYKYPTIDFNKLINVDEDKLSDEFYNQVKEKNRAQFKKEWNEKYKQKWVEEDLMSHLNRDWSHNDDYSKTYDQFKKEWLDKMLTPENVKYAYENYFSNWFNFMLKVKFNTLWHTTFKKQWLEIYKKELRKERDKLSFLKENINNLFKG